MSKKFFIALALIISFTLPLVTLAGGFELSVPTEPNRTNAIDFQALISSAIDVIWKIFVGAVVVLLIVTGILFITAQGDPEKSKKAKMALLFSIIGIIVALLGYRMINTITGLITNGVCVPAGGSCNAMSDCCNNMCSGFSGAGPGACSSGG